MMQALSAASLLLLTHLAAVSGGSGEEVKRFSAVREQIESLRKGATPDKKSSPVDLSGYNFHWEIGLPHGGLLVLISKTNSGLILRVGDNDVIQDTRDIPEFFSALLCDLDEDGVPEVVLDQKDEWGTGVLVRRYHFFRVFPTITDLGTPRESYSYLRQPDHLGTVRFAEAVGTIRCDPSGGGIPNARLSYSLERRDGSSNPARTDMTFLLEQNRLKEVH